MSSEVVKMWGIARIADLLLAIILALSINLLSGDIGELRDFFGTVWLGILAYGVVTFGALFFATSYLWTWLAKRGLKLNYLFTSAGSSVILWLSLVGIHLFGGGLEHAQWQIVAGPWIIFSVVAHGLLSWLTWNLCMRR